MSSVPSSRNKAARPVSRLNVEIAEAQRKQALSSDRVLDPLVSLMKETASGKAASRGRPE